MVRFSEKLDPKLFAINFNQLSSKPGQYYQFDENLLTQHFEASQYLLTTKLKLLKDLEKYKMQVSDVISNIYRCSYELPKKKETMRLFLKETPEKYFQ